MGIWENHLLSSNQEKYSRLYRIANRHRKTSYDTCEVCIGEDFPCATFLDTGFSADEFHANIDKAKKEMSNE